MCAKTSFFILILTYFFLHACNARPVAATTSISNKKSQTTKMEGNLKDSIGYSPSRMLGNDAASLNPKETEDICKKNKGIEGTSSAVFERTEDCQSSHHKALLQYSTKSEGSRWPNVNVREMDLRTPFFRDEDLSETDYQPPHRKAPIHNK